MPSLSRRNLHQWIYYSIIYLYKYQFTPMYVLVLCTYRALVAPVSRRVSTPCSPPGRHLSVHGGPLFKPLVDISNWFSMYSSLINYWSASRQHLLSDKMNIIRVMGTMKKERSEYKINCRMQCPDEICPPSSETTQQHQVDIFSLKKDVIKDDEKASRSLENFFIKA